MIESLLFIITLFKDIVKSFFAFATKNIYFDRFGRTNGESAVPLRAALFCASVSVFGYGRRYTEAKLRVYKGGCGPARRRGLWKRKGCRTMHFAKNPSLFKACAAPFAKTARFAQAAAHDFAFCPSRSPTAAPPVLPQNVCPPSCETFFRRLARWQSCVRRARRAIRWGNAVRRRFSQARGRRTAGEFCRNTQVKREVIHLSTWLSTMPAFYAVKTPQKRAGKEGTGKEAFPRERALI